MNQIEQYCKIEGLNSYEVLSALPKSRRLTEVAADTALRVSISAPVVTSRLWYRSMDVLRNVSEVEGNLHFLHPPDSWQGRGADSLRKLSEKEWSLQFLKPKFPWYIEKDREEESRVRTFLTERARAIPDSLYDFMIAVAEESSDTESKQLVEQLKQNRDLFNETLEMAVKRFPNTSLLSIGVNALLMLGGSRPDLLPAIAPLGIALSQTSVNSRSGVADAMNISLRDVYVTAYLVQRFADLYSYGEDRILLSKDVQLAGEQLLPIFNALGDEFESSGIIPGGLLGAAGTAALGDKGVAAAVMLGTIVASKAVIKYDQKKNKDFGKWFASSKGEQIKEMEAAIADPATATEHINSMYERSRKMAEYIHGHNTISLSFDRTFPWVMQTISAYLSWVNGAPQNLAQYLIAGRAGASEQRKITRQVSMHQALQSVERYQTKIRSTFESIAGYRQALKLIAPEVYADSLTEALETNISYDDESGAVTIHRFVDAAHQLKDLGDMLIRHGIHHLIGESGAGKSSLLNYLKLFLAENEISYTYASVESDSKESIGFKMAKILSEGKNQRIQKYFQDLLWNLDSNRDLRTEMWQDFESITKVKLSNSDHLRSVAYELWRDIINEPEKLWTEWKASHAEGYTGEKPEHLVVLDLVATHYFKDKVKINKKDILSAKGSTGETRRAQLALVNLDADFIILDELISNVDPNNIVTMINYLATELNGELMDKTLILVAHEPEVLRTFRSVTPDHIDQNVTILFPDAQITESMDQRFIAQNLEENPQELHDYIVQNVLDKIRSILRQGYSTYDELDDTLMTFIEVLEFDFPLSLSQKMKVVATMMEYRDYVADMNLTDLERYYMACTIHTINTNWSRDEQGYIVRDAFYTQMLYIADQMKATIPQCFVDEYRGWDPSDYLDNTIRRTVPKVPELSKGEPENRAAQLQLRDQALIAIFTANAHRLNLYNAQNCFDSLEQFTEVLGRGTFSSGESQELLSSIFLLIEKLNEARIFYQYQNYLEKILENLEEWTSNIPNYCQQIRELKERYVVVNLHE